MNQRMWQQAEKLGNRPYQMMTFLEKTTDGEPVYVAMIPELPGCHTHGDTEEEALELLNEVKVEFIYFMIEDGLAVPEPKDFNKFTTINMSDLEDCRTESRTAAHRKLSFSGSLGVSGATAMHTQQRVYVA